MKRLASLALIACLGATGLSCKVQLTPEGIAKTWHAIQDAQKDLTPENEYYVGRSVATNLLARNDYEYFADDGADGPAHYVNTLGNYLALTSLDLAKDGDRPTPIAGWHFAIVDDNATINAFAAPGGYIFVTAATVELAHSEDELAAVLAHEIAHVRRGHALGSIKKSRWANVYKEALDSSVQLDEKALGDLTKVFDDAMDDMIDSITVKGYSRQSELEADKLGLQIMVHAGYDPNAFIAFLERLAQHQDTGKGGFSATHPKASDRIAALKTQIAQLPAHAPYQASDARQSRMVAAQMILAAE